jgi:hypothetical protein
MIMNGIGLDILGSFDSAEPSPASGSVALWMTTQELNRLTIPQLRLVRYGSNNAWLWDI